jgi:hypothetical protein
MKIIDLFKKTEKKIACDQNEHCPLYLAYLGKYGKDSDEIKYCKNSNAHFCTKYSLINPNEWEKLSTDKKLKVVEDMQLINYIKKRED